MTIYETLKGIKSLPALRDLQADLETKAAEAAGPKSAAIKMHYDYAGDNFKKGGVAYYRALCLSHANSIVDRASARQHFIPPSEETISWGGFMGGENLVWTDEDSYEDAEKEIIYFIRAHLNNSWTQE